MIRIGDSWFTEKNKRDYSTYTQKSSRASAKKSRNKKKTRNKTLNTVFTFVYFVCKRSSVLYLILWLDSLRPLYCVCLLPVVMTFSSSLRPCYMVLSTKEFFFPFLLRSKFRANKTLSLKELLFSSMSSVADLILGIFFSLAFAISFGCRLLLIFNKRTRMEWKYRFSYFFDFMCDSGSNIILGVRHEF